MSTVAEQLRSGREARGLSIRQVAEITKIRSDHVEALEEGNFDAFVAPVYIRGFVRTYAMLLKLDVPAVMSELDSELGQTAKFAEPPPLSERQGGIIDALMLQISKVDWRKGGIGLVILALLIVLVLVFFSRQGTTQADPLSGAKPAVYQPTQTVSGDTLPLPPSSRR